MFMFNVFLTFIQFLLTFNFISTMDFLNHLFTLKSKADWKKSITEFLDAYLEKIETITETEKNVYNILRELEKLLSQKE